MVKRNHVDVHNLLNHKKIFCNWKLVFLRLIIFGQRNSQAEKKINSFKVIQNFSTRKII